MSKTTKVTAVEYNEATPQLVKRVRDVVNSAARKTYSVSLIYGAYNEVFKLNERAQTCSTCLRTRAEKLKDWLDGYDKAQSGDASKGKAATNVKPEPKTPNPDDEPFLVNGDASKPGNGVTPQYVDPSAPGFVEPAPGVIRIPTAQDSTTPEETLPLDFTPNEGDENSQGQPGAKGSVLWANGEKVKPGTYNTARGLLVAVQVGGKATIKEEDLT